MITKSNTKNNTNPITNSDKQTTNKENNNFNTNTTESTGCKPDQHPEKESKLPIDQKLGISLMNDKENIILALHVFSVSIFVFLLYDLKLIDIIRNDSRCDIAFFKLSMGLFIVSCFIYLRYILLIDLFESINEDAYSSKVSHCIPLLFFFLIGANVFFVSSFRFCFYGSYLVRIKLGLSLIFVEVIGVFLNNKKAKLCFVLVIMATCFFGMLIKLKGFLFI